MYTYNKNRNRVALSPKEKFLLGPQFMLQASATSVQERPPVKKDPPLKDTESPLQPYSAMRSRPTSFGDSSSAAVPVPELLANLPHRSGSSGSASRRAYRVATTIAQDFGSGAAFAVGAGGDADRYSSHSLSGSAQNRNLANYQPGDKVVFSEKGSVPGVPVIYRAPEEKANNPDRLNLDRRHLSVCPLLDGEDQLRLLNYQHNMIQRIDRLDSLTRLIFLDFYDNQIEQISGLDTLRSLRVLMLGKNRDVVAAEKDPSSAFKCFWVHISHCFNCQSCILSKIRAIENLDYLTKLDVLDLHGNQIKRIENLDHLSDLRVLNLAGNVIEHVENLTGLDLLTELNLRRNKIRSVSDVDTLPNLQRLFLSFNEITSFERISCIGESNSLSELALDSNPLTQEVNYKQTILRHVQQLKQLDMKRISEDERRIATVMGRKEEEKKRENSKMAILVEKRRRTINNAKHHWEQTVNSRKSSQRSKRKTMPDLYATHVATVSNSDAAELVAEDGAGSSSSSGPSSPKSSHSAEKDRKPVTANIRPKSSGPMFRTASQGALDPGFKETRSFNSDHLSEIEGETLNLYGSGSLDAFDKSWGLQAAGAVTTVCFQFIDFNDIVKVLSKIRVRFPNVNTLVFGATNIQSFAQLNALSSVRRLDNLVVEPDGNPVTSLNLWRPYVIFRLAHFSLKKVNGKEVSVSDIVGAEKYFGTLATTVSSNLPQSRMMSLLGEKKKQLLLEDKAKQQQQQRGQSDAFKALSVDKVEPVERAVLVYSQSDVHPAGQKPQEAKTRRSFLKTYLQSMNSSAVNADQRLASLHVHWVDVLSSFVRSAVVEMWDGKSYMRKCMEELERTRSVSLKEKEVTLSNIPQPQLIE